MLRNLTIGATALFAAYMLAPAALLGQAQPDAQQHEQHQATPAEQAPSTADTQASMMGMMARMKANDAKLDELVARMNKATGTAKTDVMAELLTTLVEERRTMHEPMMQTMSQNMMSMMSMMDMMHGGSGRGGMTMPSEPKK